MNCLSEEQLVQLAIGIDDSAQVAAHIEACEACRTKLADLRRVTTVLAAAHAEVDQNFATSRVRLLSNLADIEIASDRPHLWHRLKRGVARLTPRQRVAAGGLGASTAIAVVLLVLIVVNSASSLSAMERMVRQLRAVTSYRYELYTRDTFTPDGETSPTTVIHTGTTWWLAPNSLRYDEKLVRTEGKPFSSERDGLLGDYIGIHPSGGRGLMVHHFTRHKPMERTYTWIPETPAHEIGDAGPIMRLRMVRERAGEVLRELGTKEIDGKTARGFVMALANAKAGSGFDALEVWVDPKTDLPLEFGYEVKAADSTRVFRISNCQWNVEIPAGTFNTIPPAGYEDITAPSDEQTLGQIAEALKLYAKLSGGSFPLGSKFDADAVHVEMLKLAGFTGPAQPEWNADQTFQQIQSAKASLDWIERILRHRFATGYQRTGITVHDKDKPLLWWTVDIEDSYRVYYGDLHTEIIPYAQWVKIVPPEVAEDHLPTEE